MAKQSKTPLEQKFSSLPRYIKFDKDIKPELDKAGISKRTFERDRKAKASSIPHERLQVYAALFNCDVADLIDSYVKIKPIVKKDFVKRSGLKTSAK